ncbi:MAG: SIS domain-containing protein [Chloroflexota bacterium]|nr:SIS domain-containing protein [Chloroflexota bacterium]MDQ5866724.1 SIS domain-containing protein [Chloroflexota bacterium]
MADRLAEPAAEAARVIVTALQGGRKVLVFGNGGSAADAQHFAGEMVGRFKLNGRVALPVLALTTDSTVLTCVANDFSYEEVFSRQVEAFAQPGDVVLGISTSGKSQNVLRALRAARQRGATTIALLGGDGGLIAPETDLPIVVASTDTTRIQECHITLIHAISELVEAEITRTHAQAAPDGGQG